MRSGLSKPFYVAVYDNRSMIGVYDKLNQLGIQVMCNFHDVLVWGLSQMRRTGADSFTSGRNGSKRVATHVLR